MYNYGELRTEQLEFISVGDESEFEQEGRLFVNVDDIAIVVFKIAGQYFAIQDMCSHDGAPLGDGELDDHQIICPRHGARFDLRSGKVLTYPAFEDIPAYPVRVVGGVVEVGLPAAD